MGYNCKNFEDAACLCHQKCDCVNKRMEDIVKDIDDMSKDIGEEEAAELKQRFKNKLKDVLDR